MGKILCTSVTLSRLNFSTVIVWERFFYCGRLQQSLIRANTQTESRGKAIYLIKTKLARDAINERISRCAGYLEAFFFPKLDNYPANKPKQELFDTLLNWYLLAETMRDRAACAKHFMYPPTYRRVTYSPPYADWLITFFMLKQTALDLGCQLGHL